MKFWEIPLQVSDVIIIIHHIQHCHDVTDLRDPAAATVPGRRRQVGPWRLRALVLAPLPSRSRPPGTALRAKEIFSHLRLPIPMRNCLILRGARWRSPPGGSIDTTRARRCFLGAYWNSPPYPNPVLAALSEARCGAAGAPAFAMLPRYDCFISDSPISVQSTMRDV
jgi:hypothetical protein